MNTMNTVMIVPTGIGAEIGGHAGDANPAAKLLASVSENLITHPNVVNGSDINEMTENTLYVEGSHLDQFLNGNVSLKKSKGNRILVAVNGPVKNEIVNSVNAARVTLGANIHIIELIVPLKMVVKFNKDGQASGNVYGWKELVEQVRFDHIFSCFDALAINTPIEVNKDKALKYMREGGISPWGGVEALASRLIAGCLGKPVAHAPNGHCVSATFDELVDPRISAEMVSCCYLHCVLKGLHKAPRIGNVGDKNTLDYRDVDVMVSPLDCYGAPHKLCEKQGIPIIVVRENKTQMKRPIHSGIYVENYLEAAGMIKAMEIGVSYGSVTRPIGYTAILK